MSPRACLLAVLLGAGALAAAHAAPLGDAAPLGRLDPDWPCMQIKVPELSVASIWAGPSIEPYRASWSADPAVAELAARLMQRRLDMTEAKAEIAAFAHAAGAQRQPKLLALFAGVFDDANRERASILAGLDRFGRRQKELATSIRTEVTKLQGTQSGAATDETPIAGQQTELTWDLKVFQGRRQAISYACDAPSLVEQRLFALSRAIQAALPPSG